ncbi:hypothetical protein EGW08_023795, partial [Elysia chlorotica]
LDLEGYHDDHLPRELPEDVLDGSIGTLEYPAGAMINGKAQSIPQTSFTNGNFQPTRKLPVEGKVSTGLKQNTPTSSGNTTIVVGKPKIPQKPPKLGALEGFIGNSPSVEEDLNTGVNSATNASTAQLEDSKPPLVRLTSFTADSEDAILPFIEKTPVLSPDSIKRHVERSINPASQAPQVPVHALNAFDNSSTSTHDKASNPNPNSVRTKSDSTTQNFFPSSVKTDGKLSNTDTYSARTKREVSPAYNSRVSPSSQKKSLPFDESSGPQSPVPPPLPPRPTLPSLGKTQAPVTLKPTLSGGVNPGMSKSASGAIKPLLALSPKPGVANSNGFRSPGISDTCGSKEFYFGYDSSISTTTTSML